MANAMLEKIEAKRAASSETITPHKLTLAVLIRSYCNFRDLDDFKSIIDETLKAKYRRDFCVLMLKFLQSPDITLKELRNILLSSQYHIHQSVIHSFDKCLLELYSNGTGAMLDIIDSFNRIMTFNENNVIETNSTICKSSIIGYYLRRLIINFDKLTFSEVTAVFAVFQRYYEEWQRDMQKNDPPVEVVETNQLEPHDWPSNRWSRRQAELFIATQAALLSNNEEQALSPPELQEKITNLLESNKTLSEAHFLSYLNYLRVKEFCGAIDSLYHCFDRSSLPDNAGTVEDKSKVHRFAALNLAILHYHFGHKEEALASLKEAIRISQSANDNICLQHALTWLCRLTITNGHKFLLNRRIYLKGFELNFSYTSSLGIQFNMKNACALHLSPHDIFEFLAHSDVVSCHNNLRDLISNSYAIKSALWQFYGKSEMSSLWSQLLFYLNIDIMNDNKAIYGEGYCLAICNLSQLLLQQGNYNFVEIILNYARERFPNEPNSNIWMLIENLFKFQRNLYNENYQEAESAAQNIFVIDKWEGYLRMAEVCLYKQDFAEAHRIINVIINKYQSEKLSKFKTHYYIRAKILLAEVQFATPQPNIVPSGMTLLNECLLEADKNYLDYHSTMIHLHMANLQLSLGMVSQAFKLLERCLIQILAHGGCFDRARGMLLYVKCLVAQAQEMADLSERRKNLQSAVEMLDGVKNDFRNVEAFSRVKDVLYLQAHIFNILEMKNERNKCALEFRQLEEERATKNHFTLVKYL